MNSVLITLAAFTLRQCVILFGQSNQRQTYARLVLGSHEWFRMMIRCKCRGIMSSLIIISEASIVVSGLMSSLILHLTFDLS